MNQYPGQISTSIDKFSYQLGTHGLPQQGIEGKGAFNADYSAVKQLLTISKLTFSANDSDLSGQISVRLDDKPLYQLDLAAKTLNLDRLLERQPPTDSNNAQAKSRGASTGQAVIASSALADNVLSNLKDFSGKLSLRAQNVVYHGLTMTDLNVQADNHHGQLRVNTFTGKLGEGGLMCPACFMLQGHGFFSIFIRNFPVLR
ncbi:MAG: hypothetical protein ACTXOO_03180 [Sodalis sp. (in: enterobacteria)]